MTTFVARVSDLILDITIFDNSSIFLISVKSMIPKFAGMPDLNDRLCIVIYTSSKFDKYDQSVSKAVIKLHKIICKM